MIKTLALMVASLLSLASLSETRQLQADELTVPEKMMEAASTILADKSGYQVKEVQGHVVVDSGSTAHFVFNNSNIGMSTQFNKLSDCTFGLVQKHDGFISKLFISFDKLTGPYSSDGRNITFEGRPKTFGVYSPSNNLGHSYQSHLTLYDEHYPQRIINDIIYLSKHGCGNLDPDDQITKFEKDLRAAHIPDIVNKDSH